MTHPYRDGLVNPRPRPIDQDQILADSVSDRWVTPLTPDLSRRLQMFNFYQPLTHV